MILLIRLSDAFQEMGPDDCLLIFGPVNLTLLVADIWTGLVFFQVILQLDVQDFLVMVFLLDVTLHLRLSFAFLVI